MFLHTFCRIFANMWSTCNSSRSNMSVRISIIRLLRSNSAKISFSNTLLISKKIFLFTTTISIALYWSWDVGKYLETLRIFSLCSHLVSNPALLEKIFPQAFSRKVWSKISYGDESTSSQTLNYFLCIFSGKTFCFSTNWKYQRLPIWLKTFNPKGCAAKSQ